MADAEVWARQRAEEAKRMDMKATGRGAGRGQALHFYKIQVYQAEELCVISTCGLRCSRFARMDSVAF